MFLLESTSELILRNLRHVLIFAQSSSADAHKSTKEFRPKLPRLELRKPVGPLIATSLS